MTKGAIRALAAIALAGCGGYTFPFEECVPASKCSADPPLSDAVKRQWCEGPKSADGGTPRCNAEAATFNNCATAKQVCGADNKTDAAATLASCQAEHDAYTKCLAGP